MYLINEKIKKGQPMPCICELCGNVDAIRKSGGRDIKTPTNNKCFEQCKYPNGKEYSYAYLPFTNSKRKAWVNCKNFSHMRTLSVR